MAFHHIADMHKEFWANMDRSHHKGFRIGDLCEHTNLSGSKRLVTIVHLYLLDDNTVRICEGDDGTWRDERSLRYDVQVKDLRLISRNEKDNAYLFR